MNETRIFKSLNPKRQRFLTEIMKGRGVFESYRLAGYKGKGQTGQVAASRLLHTPIIQQALEELKTVHSEACKDEIEQVRERAIICARYEISNLDKKPEEWSEETKQAIASTTVVIEPTGTKITHQFERYRFMKLLLDGEIDNKKESRISVEDKARKVMDMMHDLGRQMDESIPECPSKFLPNGITPWPTASSMATE